MSSFKFKVAHLTSVHPRYDTRIFLKECQSLANNGYDVSLVVADGNGDELNSKVNIYDVGKLSGRINRMLRTTKKVYQKALELDSDVYHLHDPELIPIGLKLLKKGKKVIFDAHEDLPSQVLSKPYLKSWQARPLSWLVKKLENYALAKYSGVAAATPFIRDKFAVINACTVDINNYPSLKEFTTAGNSHSVNTKSKPVVCYVGGLSKVRGIKEIVQSMAYVQSNVRLEIAGEFSTADFEKEVRELYSWSGVRELGFLDRGGIQHVLSNSIAGLVTLHPIINYLDSLPVKMFEYMAAGLPVISSNIPLWKEIIEGNECGICVNPMDPKQIAESIDYLVRNPKEAKMMGSKGKQAILARYNWGIEEKKLLNFYEAL